MGAQVLADRDKLGWAFWTVGKSHPKKQSTESIVTSTDCKRVATQHPAAILTLRTVPQHKVVVRAVAGQLVASRHQGPSNCEPAMEIHTIVKTTIPGIFDLEREQGQQGPTGWKHRFSGTWSYRMIEVNHLANETFNLQVNRSDILNVLVSQHGARFMVIHPIPWESKRHGSPQISVIKWIDES